MTLNDLDRPLRYLCVVRSLLSIEVNATHTFIGKKIALVLDFIDVQVVYKFTGWVTKNLDFNFKGTPLFDIE